MKRGRRNLLIAVGCVVFGVVVWVAWPGEREPEYQGKKLSEWLSTFEPSPELTADKLRDASGALHHIGTSAVPWLVRWIAYERPAWQRRQWAVNAVSKVPIASFRCWAIGGDSARADAAVIALGSLGPEAKAAAVPELTKLIHNDRKHASRDRAIEALGNLGQVGIPALEGLMEEKAIAGDLHTVLRCMELVKHPPVVRVKPEDMTNAWRSDM